MAAVDVLISSDNFKENKPFKMHITHHGKEEFKGPEGVIGQRPREFDQFRVEKTYSNGNLGLSSATAYQAIHSPEQNRNSYSVLIHSLPRQGLQYKQNSARSKLPNLFQRSSARKIRQSSPWRNSSVPSTTLYASTTQTNENTLPVRPNTSASRFVSFTSSPFNWAGSGSHATISATGQALLSESYKNRSFYNPTLSNKHSMSSGTHLPHHTLVNYVPFYEHRGRGDGASEVDSPSKDKPPKKTPSPVGANISKEVSEAMEKGAAEKRAPSALKSRSNSPEWPGAAGKHISTYGKQEKKRVRFSSAVTDKMEEPPYVETLLHSVSKKLQRGVKEGWASVEGSKDNEIEIRNEKKSTTVEAINNVDEEEDSTTFVSPITRVTVTRRKIQPEDPSPIAPISTAPPIFQQSKNSPTKPFSQQKILDMATRILNNSSNVTNIPNTTNDNTEDVNGRPEVQTPSRPPTRNATGFVAVRPNRKGNIIPLSKYVQKKQVIISPSFPDQAPKQRKPFMSYAAKLNRSDSSRKQPALEPPKVASAKVPVIRGASYRQTAPLSGQPSKQPVQYISLDLKINNLAHSPRTSVLAEPPRSSNLLQANATHFQPIPSMPDHINFCDPRKTEHILEWLDDVNKKRNIESKFIRGSSSMSAKTVS